MYTRKLTRRERFIDWIANMLYAYSYRVQKHEHQKRGWPV